MATLMYTLISMSFHCSVRQEISPCTCSPHEIIQDTIHVTCDGVGSFNQVFDALQNKFLPSANIWLKITNSQLEDLETRSFQDMGFNIKNLRLNYNHLRILPESSFRNLSSVQYLSFSDNELDEVPIHILNQMSNLGTLDLANGNIHELRTNDLKAVKRIGHIVLVNNGLTILEKDSIPHGVSYLHLGRNNLTTLNETLRNLNNMEVLFINENKLNTLDNELPIGSQKLKSIIGHHNHLVNLPKEMETFSKIDSLYFSNNDLTSLNGTLKHGRTLLQIFFSNNFIEYLADDEFQYCADLETLDFGNNKIKALNNSLLPLKNIRRANFSHNLLNEFSLNEIVGLKYFRMLDLSYNRIEKLTGVIESEKNIIEPGSYLYELNLRNNKLKSLHGGMLGFNKLHELNLAYNEFEYLSTDDLMGLEELETLDISHNYLRTLEDTAKVFLPNLEKLYASFNSLTHLEKAFHGLPTLCLADLSNNKILTMSPELVSKTRCVNHGVLNKLEILLQENPLLCKDELPDLLAQMEEQEARLLGIAHCIVQKEDLPIHPELFTRPLITSMEQLPLLPNAILNQQQTPSIVQVILPAPILLKSLSENAQQQQQQQQQLHHQKQQEQQQLQQEQQQMQQLQQKQLLSTLLSTTSLPLIAIPETTEITPTSATIPNKLLSSSVPPQTIESNKLRPSSATSTLIPIIIPLEQNPFIFNDDLLTSSSSMSGSSPAIASIEMLSLTQPKPTTTTTTTLTPFSSIIDTSLSSSTSSLASSTTTITSIPQITSSLNAKELMDNSVHETFSPLPPHVINTNLDRSQQNLLELDEPPEMLQDENVSTTI